MTYSTDKIFESIYYNPDLNKRIIRLVKSDLRDDMKSHLIIQLSKMNPDKLNKLYESNELIKYTMRMLYYQLSPRCKNCFYQMYNPLIFKRDDGQQSNGINYESQPELEIRDKAPDVYDKAVKEIMNIVHQLRPHKYQIFYMSYVEGYSNTEIALKSKVSIQTVANYNTYILKEIKNKLQERGYTININNN